MTTWSEENNWNGKDSRAVLFFDGKQGFVLYWVGADIDFEIGEASRDLEDLGFVGAWASSRCKTPLGFSIWEGRYVTQHSFDDSSVPEGKFRPLLPEEWSILALEHRAPWDEKEWRLR